MQITDLNGNVIEITDLNAAIEDADFGRGCRHNDTSMAAFDDKQNAYWQDFYDKLLSLKRDNSLFYPFRETAGNVLYK